MCASLWLLLTVASVPVSETGPAGLPWNDARSSTPVRQAALLRSATPVSPIDQPPVRSTEPSKSASIQIRVFGDRIVLMSDDPEALALATGIAHLFAHVRLEERRIEVFRLKHAPAMATAMLLSELLNGQRPAANSPANNGLNLLASLFGQQPPPAPALLALPGEQRVRIVPVPATNVLMIQATTSDLGRIRTMLESGLDSPPAGSRDTVRTWVLPSLQNGNALSIAQLLRDVYREQLYDDTTLPLRFELTGPALFELFRGQLLTAVAATARTVRTGNLWISVDVPANRLVLACPEKTKIEIEKLVAQLDDAALKAPRVVQVLRVQGVSPQVVQRAVESLQGRQASNSSRPTTDTAMPSAVPQRGGLFSPGVIVPVVPGLSAIGFGGYPPAGNSAPRVNPPSGR
jgi:hypothetical protein